MLLLERGHGLCAELRWRWWLCLRFGGKAERDLCEWFEGGVLLERGVCACVGGQGVLEMGLGCLGLGEWAPGWVLLAAAVLKGG